MSGKKDVVKIREEIKILENEKKINPGHSEEHAKSISPYICSEVPTLFNIVYRESEKDYIQIIRVMLDNLEKLNSGEINTDKATEQLGKFLFEKLVKPNIPEEE